MKTIVKALGVAMMIIGVVWILQGVNVLPGSFMTGHIEWAVYGAIAAAVGIAMFKMGKRPGR